MVATGTGAELREKLDQIFLKNRKDNLTHNFVVRARVNSTVPPDYKHLPEQNTVQIKLVFTQGWLSIEVKTDTFFDKCDGNVTHWDYGGRTLLYQFGGRQFDLWFS